MKYIRASSRGGLKSTTAIYPPSFHIYSQNMPIRQAKESSESIFSRTIHANASRIVSIEHHDTPPSMIPTAPEPTVAHETADSAESSDQGHSHDLCEMDYGENPGLVGAHSEALYPELVPEMLEEPMPMDTVSILSTFLLKLSGWSDAIELPKYKSTKARQLVPQRPTTHPIPLGWRIAPFFRSSCKHFTPKTGLASIRRAPPRVKNVSLDMPKATIDASIALDVPFCAHSA